MRASVSRGYYPLILQWYSGIKSNHELYVPQLRENALRMAIWFLKFGHG